MTAPAAVGRAGRLLPPRPRPVDAVWMGASAGLCLAAAEMAELWLRGIDPPGRVLLEAASLTAALSAAGAGLVAAGLGVAGRRPSHSAWVGIALGLLLAAPVAADALRELATAGTGDPLRLVLGLGLAAGAGAAAGWSGGRLERAGLVLPGPAVWLVAAGLVGLAGLAGQQGALSPGLGLLVAGVLVFAGLAAALATRAARQAPVVPRAPARTFLLLAVGVAALAWGPRLLPWLLAEPLPAGAVPEGRGLLVVDLGEFAPGAAPQPVTSGPGGVPAPELALLAASGVLYPRLLTADDARAGWLRLVDGVPLPRVLRARGWASSWVGAPVGPAPAGFEEDAGPPEAELSARTLAATTGGALRVATGLARDVAAAPARDLAALTDTAARRLFAARALAPDEPFFLLVDFGGTSRDVAALDEATGRLLATVSALDLAPRTTVVVSWTEQSEGGGRAVRRALVRPAADAPVPRGALATPVLAPSLAAALARTERDGDAAPLPGLP